jgi:hypothetical protein
MKAGVRTSPWEVWNRPDRAGLWISAESEVKKKSGLVICDMTMT